MNFLVETKNEYTIQLINILSPHIYEGFESIYTESKKIIKKGEEKKLLKAFQQFIKRIPDWNTNLIENETIRIRNASRCDFLHNLLKAVIKANIILLSNSNSTSSKSVIEKKYFDISLNKFIHRCYVECARQFYNAPYLFYHDMKPIDRKRNQRDCYDIIKNSIKEAIRKILPVQHILNKYLGDNLKLGIDEVDKPISTIESENLKQLISKDLSNSNLNTDNKLLNEDIIPTKLVDKLSINTVKNDDNQSSSDDETLNLLSEIKKNINNVNLDKSNIEMIEEDKINMIKSDYYSENNINLSKNKVDNLESESSLINIGKDEDYEDVFSNLNDTNLSEYKNNKTLNDKFTSKKMKDSYFSRINMI